MKFSLTVTASFSKDQLYCIEIYFLDFLLATMTLTIKIRSSSASSASMNYRLRDVLNEHLSNSPLPFSDWKQTWKDTYSNQHTGGQTATYIFHCLLAVSVYHPSRNSSRALFILGKKTYCKQKRSVSLQGSRFP